MRKTLTWAVLVAALFVSGCSSQMGETARHYVAEKGRAEAAASLENAEWWLCRAAPVGSVLDRYAGRWEAWRELCSGRAPELAP